eukprot:m.297410 g.297410  ORF g.297410 m.297410 type:complete len:465 (-) comp13606_c0_seq1:158-1552(-)
MAETELCAGVLTKQGRNVKSWKRRMFVLTADGRLEYYKDVQRRVLRGHIDMAQVVSISGGSYCSCTWPRASKPHLRLGIFTDTRALYVYADDRPPLENWLKAFALVLTPGIPLPNLDEEANDRPTIDFMAWRNSDARLERITIAEDGDPFNAKLIAMPESLDDLLATARDALGVPALSASNLAGETIHSSDDLKDNMRVVIHPDPADQEYKLLREQRMRNDYFLVADSAGSDGADSDDNDNNDGSGIGSKIRGRMGSSGAAEAEGFLRHELSSSMGTQTDPGEDANGISARAREVLGARGAALLAAARALEEAGFAEESESDEAEEWDNDILPADPSHFGVNGDGMYVEVGNWDTYMEVERDAPIHHPTAGGNNTYMEINGQLIDDNGYVLVGDFRPQSSVPSGGYARATGASLVDSDYVDILSLPGRPEASAAADAPSPTATDSAGSTAAAVKPHESPKRSSP